MAKKIRMEKEEALEWKPKNHSWSKS